MSTGASSPCYRLRLVPAWLVSSLRILFEQCKSQGAAAQTDPNSTAVRCCSKKQLGFQVIHRFQKFWVYKTWIILGYLGQVAFLSRKGEYNSYVRSTSSWLRSFFCWGCWGCKINHDLCSCIALTSCNLARLVFFATLEVHLRAHRATSFLRTPEPSLWLHHGLLVGGLEHEFYFP